LCIVYTYFNACDGFISSEQAQSGGGTPVEHPSGRRKRQHTGVHRGRVRFRSGERTGRHSRDAGPSYRRRLEHGQQPRNV